MPLTALSEYINVYKAMISFSVLGFFLQLQNLPPKLGTWQHKHMQVQCGQGLANLQNVQ